MSESDVLKIVAKHDLSVQAQAVLDRIIAERDALAAELVGHREQLSICEHLQRAHIDRIRELEAEVEALKHDLEKSMANHVADINGSASETVGKHDGP